MKVSFDKVMLSEVYVSENGAQYGTFVSEDGTFKIAARGGSFDLEGLPRLEAMSLRCLLKGRLGQFGQTLEAVDLSVQLLNKPAPAAKS